MNTQLSSTSCASKANLFITPLQAPSINPGFYYVVQGGGGNDFPGGGGHGLGASWTHYIDHPLLIKLGELFSKLPSLKLTLDSSKLFQFTEDTLAQKVTHFFSRHYTGISPKEITSSASVLDHAIWSQAQVTWFWGPIVPGALPDQEQLESINKDKLEKLESIKEAILSGNLEELFNPPKDSNFWKMDGETVEAVMRFAIDNNANLFIEKIRKDTNIWNLLLPFITPQLVAYSLERGQTDILEDYLTHVVDVPAGAEPLKKFKDAAGNDFLDLIWASNLFSKEKKKELLIHLLRIGFHLSPASRNHHNVINFLSSENALDLVVHSVNESASDKKWHRMAVSCFQEAEKVENHSASDQLLDGCLKVNNNKDFARLLNVAITVSTPSRMQELLVRYGSTFMPTREDLMSILLPMHMDEHLHQLQTVFEFPAFAEVFDTEFYNSYALAVTRADQVDTLKWLVETGRLDLAQILKTSGNSTPSSTLSIALTSNSLEVLEFLASKVELTPQDLQIQGTHQVSADALMIVLKHLEKPVEFLQEKGLQMLYDYKSRSTLSDVALDEFDALAQLLDTYKPKLPKEYVRRLVDKISSVANDRDLDYRCYPKKLIATLETHYSALIQETEGLSKVMQQLIKSRR